MGFLYTPRPRMIHPCTFSPTISRLGGWFGRYQNNKVLYWPQERLNLAVSKQMYSYLSYFSVVTFNSFRNPGHGPVVSMVSCFLNGNNTVARFCLGCCHLVFSCKFWRFSLLHLDLNWSANYWTRLHWRRANSPGGEPTGSDFISLSAALLVTAVEIRPHPIERYGASVDYCTHLSHECH